MYHIIHPRTQEITGSFIKEQEAKYYAEEWGKADRIEYLIDWDDIPDYDLEWGTNMNQPECSKCNAPLLYDPLFGVCESCLDEEMHREYDNEEE